MRVLAVIVLCLLLGTCSPHLNVLEQVQNAGVIKVVTRNAPTTFYQGPEGPVGPEYELARGFAEFLGVELEIYTLDAATHLEHVDGVMVGRAAYQTPYLLADVDRVLFGSETPAPRRGDVLARLLPYVQEHIARGGRLNSVTRHILGLYHGQPRARVFRRYLSENGVGEGPGIGVLRDAIAIAEGRPLGTDDAAEADVCAAE